MVYCYYVKISIKHLKYLKSQGHFYMVRMKIYTMTRSTVHIKLNNSYIMSISTIGIMGIFFLDSKWNCNEF